MAVLTYVTIQNMVLEDAFPESKRTDAKAWIVDAHTELWDAADYVFKSVLAAATVANGVITAPTDIADVFAIYDPQGAPLQAYYDVKQFFDIYNSSALATGTVAEAYVCLGNTVVVKPSTTGTMTGYQVAYRKVKPTLSADTDLSGLPDGYDMALVHGAKRIGFTLINNPFADDFGQLFEAKKRQLKDSYTFGVDEAGVQTPAFRGF